MPEVCNAELSCRKAGKARSPHEAGKLGNWEIPHPGGSGQIGNLGKVASRRNRVMWETGIARFLEEAGKLGYWESPLPGGSVQIGKLGKPASRRKRADWEFAKRVDRKF